MTRAAGVAVLAATGALALTAPAVRAGNEWWPRAGCSDVSFTDPRGDTSNRGLDVVSVFLSVREDDVYANLMVADLDGRVEHPKSHEEFFEVKYLDDRGRGRKVEARLLENGTRAGATWFDGDDGVVQVPLPRLSPRTTTQITVATGGEEASAVVALDDFEHFTARAGVHLNRTYADRVEPRWVQAMCGNQPAHAKVWRPSAAAAEQEVRVVAGTPRARGRTLRVPLRSSGPVTRIEGQLTRGRRVVARGRLDALDGRGTLVLTARRKLRPGVYLLTIPGVVERRVRID